MTIGVNLNVFKSFRNVTRIRNRPSFRRRRCQNVDNKWDWEEQQFRGLSELYWIMTFELQSRIPSEGTAKNCSDVKSMNTRAIINIIFIVENFENIKNQILLIFDGEVFLARFSVVIILMVRYSSF